MTSVPISIVGDSFGCGEWRHDPAENDTLVCVHAGTEFYLKQFDFQVKNYSIGGNSMKDLLTPIVENNIRKQTIIVFATDSLRHIDEMSAQKLYVKKSWSVSKLHYECFMSWVKNLTKITQQQKCKVVLVGGFGNLYNFPIPSNMQVCTHSWISDILGTTIGHQSGIENESLTKLHALQKYSSNNYKKEFIDIMDQKTYRENLLKTHPAKFPDGIHPSRECHKLLTEKLIKLID